MTIGVAMTDEAVAVAEHPHEAEAIKEHTAKTGINNAFQQHVPPV